jgi:hypothetical protein
MNVLAAQIKMVVIVYYDFCDILACILLPTARHVTVGQFIVKPPKEVFHRSKRSATE